MLTSEPRRVVKIGTFLYKNSSKPAAGIAHSCLPDEIANVLDSGSLESAILDLDSYYDALSSNFILKKQTTSGGGKESME